MDKTALLKLYPEFDSVLGPYIRKDGRKHIVLNKSWLIRRKGKLRTVSYPKALLEIKINRRLLEHETCDHKDEDFTNDHPDNLQVLTRLQNAIKGACRNR